MGIVKAIPDVPSARNGQTRVCAWRECRVIAEADSGQEDENAVPLYPAKAGPTALEYRVERGANWSIVKLVNETGFRGNRQV
jgi:hypothetical protein